MDVRKSDGSYEEFSRRKLATIIKKVFKTADVKCDADCVKEIIDSLYIYDGILCSSIRKQLEERFSERDERLLKAYRGVKNKKEEIENFVERKINYINNYKKASNTANATVDDNSNVANKNIGVLNAEIHKEDNIQISRKMIMGKLKELYPTFNPKNYIKDLEHHIIYKHDESSFAGAIAPYTYSAKEVIEVKYNGNHYVLPFDQLWNIVEEEELLVDKENDVWQKYPEDLFVRECDNEFVPITTLTKKKRHRDLVRVKTSFGEDMVVTDNHPLITDKDNINNTIEAINSVDRPQFKTDDVLNFGNKDGIDVIECPDIQEYSKNYCINYSGQVSKRHIKVDWNLGYFVGFFVGDGNYNNGSGYINFTQKDKEVLVKLNEIMFESVGVAGRIRYKRDKQKCYTLSTPSSVVWWLLSDVFHVEDKAQNKTLPINFLEFNEDFSKGLICGLMDSDGTVNGSQLSIRLSSRACILQTTAILRHFGYGVGNTMQNLPFSNNSNHYNTNYTVWGVNCSAREGCVNLGNSDKLNKIINMAKDSSLKYKKSGETKIISVTKISESDAFLTLNEYIYDITTGSRCFSMNNLLVHNCVSLTMYPFLTNGLKHLGGLSAEPKNIDSYCGMYCNLIFAVSSQFAGAVATSESLLYFTYFCKKEWGENFYNESDSFYKIGYKLRELLNKSHYWTNNARELAEHDFGSEELNNLRDELVYESERSLTEDELKDYCEHIKNDPSYVLKFGDGTRTIKGQIHQYWQQIVYTISQPAAARGYQSAFVNFSYFDKPFFDGMFGNFYFPDGSQPDWESLKWIEKEFMMWFNNERLKCLLTFPVESFTLLYKDGKFEDEEMFNFVCEEYARGHSFFTYISDSVDSLSSCCRLKNKIQTKEFNFTNGNIGVQTGSKSVITLNLSRIIQDWFNGRKEKNNDFVFTNSDLDYNSLKSYLNKILERVYKYHTAYNELLWDMYDANLLPVYKSGFIDLNKQYLTIGLNGLNQAAEFLGIKCTDNEDYAKFCQNIFGDIKEQNTLHKVTEEKHKLTFNTEQVPAESLAVKNYKWDKEDDYWVPEDTNLYASYVYKPNENLSIFEKIRLMGRNYVGEYLDGGSAAHLNLDSHLSKKQYEKILKYAAENGCSYLTFNVPNCQCEDCGFIAKQPFDKCPHCGSSNVSLWDRIIGYLTKIKNWSDGRQIEQKLRVYDKIEKE